MTPEQVHYRMDKQIYQQRSQVLADAFQKNPNRFKGKVPVPKLLPVAAWINKPATDELESNLLTRVSHFHWHIPGGVEATLGLKYSYKFSDTFGLTGRLGLKGLYSKMSAAQDTDNLSSRKIITMK